MAINKERNIKREVGGMYRKLPPTRQSKVSLTPARPHWHTLFRRRWAWSWNQRILDLPRSEQLRRLGQDTDDAEGFCKAMRGRRVSRCASSACVGGRVVVSQASGDCGRRQGTGIGEPSAKTAKTSSDIVLGSAVDCVFMLLSASLSRWDAAQSDEWALGLSSLGRRVDVDDDG